jgi:hypothetical protein
MSSIEDGYCFPKPPAKTEREASFAASDGSALLAAALACLRTNGGPIDGADTTDGQEYVMVRMDSFKALEAAAKAPHEKAHRPHK